MEQTIYSGEVASNTYEPILRARNPAAYAISDTTLFWADRISSTIRRQSVSGESSTTLVEGTGEVTDIALHVSSSSLYWIQENHSGSGEIRRADLSGSGAATVVHSVGGAESLEVDTTASRLYWLVDGDFRGIVRSKLDGSELDTLAMDLSAPYDLALDQHGGHLYWTDWQETGRSLVMRAETDGSNTETVVDSFEAIAVAVDGDAGRLYWSVQDTLWASNLDGEDPEMMVEDAGIKAGNDDIRALKRFGEYLYWREEDQLIASNLRRYAPSSSAADTILVGFREPAGLTVDSTRGRLYWTAGQAKVLRSDLDGTDVTEVIEWPCAIGRIGDITLDMGQGMMYWSYDCEWAALYEATLEGNDVRREEYVDEGKPPLAIDTEREELFWVVNGRIHRSRPDSIFAGAYGDPLTKEISDPVGMAFDQHTDQLYVANMNEGTIERIRRDGTEREIIYSGLDQPQDIALDLSSEQMVWIESGNGTVWRSALDGTDKEQLFSGLSDPQYVAVAGAKAIAAPVPEDIQELPTQLTLHENYPNPFNPATTIAYELPRATDVRLTVFDLLGRRIRTLVDRRQAPGRHEVRFEASGLPSGLYFYRLQAGAVSRTRTMTLVQ